jgi:hypothetical protein
MYCTDMLNKYMPLSPVHCLQAVTVSWNDREFMVYRLPLNRSDDLPSPCYKVIEAVDIMLNLHQLAYA